MDGLAHADDVLIHARSTRRDHALDTLMLAELLDYKRRLHGKLSHRYQDKGLDFV